MAQLQCGNGVIVEQVVKIGDSHLSFFSGTGAGTVTAPTTALGISIKNTDATNTLTVQVATGDTTTLVAGETYKGVFPSGLASVVLTGTATYKGEWLV